jgi:hypothetical protein
MNICHFDAADGANSERYSGIATSTAPFAIRTG